MDIRKTSEAYSYIIHGYTWLPKPGPRNPIANQPIIDYPMVLCVPDHLLPEELCLQGNIGPQTPNLYIINGLLQLGATMRGECN
jgi:hypothetical protein